MLYEILQKFTIYIVLTGFLGYLTFAVSLWFAPLLAIHLYALAVMQNMNKE